MRCRQSADGQVLPQVPRGAGRGCGGCPRSAAAGAPAPRRQDPAVAVDARRRTEAGDRALRRREGLDGARRAHGPGGVVADHATLLPDPRRWGGTLRGIRRQVHRRRDHGALRRPDRPRASRATGVLDGTPSPRGGRALRDRGEARARHRFLGATGPALGRGRRGHHRRRPPHELHGAGSHRRARATNGGARLARYLLPLGVDRHTRCRLLRARGSRGVSRQRPERPGARASPGRTRHRTHSFRRLALARPHALRRARRRHADARGRAHRGAGRKWSGRRHRGRGRHRQEPALSRVRRALSCPRDHRRTPTIGSRAKRSPAGCSCSTRACARCCRSSSSSSACPTRRCPFRRWIRTPNSAKSSRCSAVRSRIPRPGRSIWWW